MPNHRADVDDVSASAVVLFLPANHLCSVAHCVQVLWSESLQNGSGDGLGPDSQITSIAFLPDLEALCVAASTGELLLVPTSREVQEASLGLPAVHGRPAMTK